RLSLSPLARVLLQLLRRDLHQQFSPVVSLRKIRPLACSLSPAMERRASPHLPEALSLSGRSRERKTPRAREKRPPTRSTFWGWPLKRRFPLRHKHAF